MIRSLRFAHFAYSTSVLAVLALTMVGCTQRELPVEYGRRQAAPAGQSVSGTAALARLFELNGSTVRGAAKLSDRLDRSQVIIWAPDTFKGPSAAERTYLESWLYNQGYGGRTLIYIGRDFDPAERYWELISADSKPPESFERKRRWADIKSSNEAERAAIPPRQSYEWFDMVGGLGERKIDSLDGPWAQGVDPAKADLWLNTRLDLPSGKVSPVIPAPVLFPAWTKKATKAPVNQHVQLGTGTAEILLQSENDMLAFRHTWDEVPSSQVIVVANGSFCLNMPLANAEHRKLAMRLVRACPSGNVVFLESGAAGVPIKETSDGERGHAWRLMMSWPLGVIVIHFAALGLVFLIARFLQFGRARSLPRTKLADFGKHVEALGQLMARTKDHAYATNNLQQYRLKARRASGARHDQSHALEVAPGAIHEVKVKAAPIELKIPPRVSQWEKPSSARPVIADSPAETAAVVDPPPTGLSNAGPASGPSSAPPPDNPAN
jgi:hypothetical protein